MAMYFLSENGTDKKFYNKLYNIIYKKILNIKKK